MEVKNNIRITSDSGVCSTGVCEEITGLWTDSRFLDPYGLGNNRTKMMGESMIDIDVNLSLESYKLCILYEVREVNSAKFLSNLGDVTLTHLTDGICNVLSMKKRFLVQRASKLMRNHLVSFSIHLTLVDGPQIYLKSRES